MPISAALQAASRFAGPAVKLSMAGTRPKAWSPKKATATAAVLGSSTPAMPSLGTGRAMRAPRTRLPSTSLS